MYGMQSILSLCDTYQELTREKAFLKGRPFTNKEFRRHMRSKRCPKFIEVNDPTIYQAVKKSSTISSSYTPPPFRPTLPHPSP